MHLNEIQYLDRTKGAARQGDVLIWPLPEKYELARQEKVAARHGRIILLEGEVTGHHHSIGLRRPSPTMFRDDAIACSVGSVEELVGDATLYKDDALAQALVRDGVLQTSELCVGFLEVESAPVLIEHQEHGFISVPLGIYYIGRQQEYSLGGLRNVQD